ncbi:uncharacterized protein PSFLO_00725 [Pseudozyma flocculosa]|uniref:Amine oxidase domain-containing protein n=1 Tax=Pseudozyma flocculosa TaxID=84751 RepID=A0A5C3ESG1_9BASI|nr:uncharacterized protein PSFLO_00725 [Pseudozyma flocculosa]
MPSTHPHVVVLGGGIAGLTAARNLAAHGINVTLLEARNRLGGRIHTSHFHHGGHDGDQGCTSPSPSTAATTSRPVDLGASFIHGIVGNPLIDLAKEVPLAIARPNEASTRYLLDRSGGKSLDRDLAQRIDFFSHATTFQRLQRAAQHGHRTPLPQESIWSGLVDAKSYPDVWKGIDDAEKDCILSVASLWSGWTGARLSDVSLRWWGFEQEFPGEDVVVQPGYSHLVEWSADKIRQAGGRIVTQRRVEAVELLSDDRVRVTATDVSTASQPTVEYEATHVITALPLGVMQRTPPRFDPPLPPRRTEALQRLGMGLLNKIVLSYDRAWWLNADDGEADAWLFLLPSDFGSHDAATTHRTARQQAAMPSDEDEARTLIESGGMAVMDYSAVNGHPVLVAYAGPPVAQALEMVPPQWTVSTLHSRLVQSLVPPTVAPGQMRFRTHLHPRR